MKKTLLGLSLLAASFMASVPANAYTLYADRTTSLRLYGPIYLYGLFDRDNNYNSKGENQLNRSQYFRIRPIMYFYKRLDNKVSLTAYARFNFYYRWGQKFTRTLNDVGDRTIGYTVNDRKDKMFYNDRFYIRINHTDYGSISLGKQSNFNLSFAGGYATFLTPYDLGSFNATIGGLSSDKAVSYGSPRFGNHSFGLGVAQTNAGTQTFYSFGYNYNIPDNKGTVYVYGAYNKPKSSYKKGTGAKTSLERFGTEVGYYATIGNYRHVVYLQYANNSRSFDNTAKTIGSGIGYSGYYSFGKPNVYFTIAGAKRSVEASNVKTKTLYAGGTVGLSYRFFTVKSFSLTGYLEYYYQYTKTKVETNTYSSSLGTNSGAAGFILYF